MVVHRDVKLENLLWEHDGDAAEPQVGIARVLEGMELASVGMHLVPIPEMCEGTAAVLLGTKPKHVIDGTHIMCDEAAP